MEPYTFRMAGNFLHKMRPPIGTTGVECLLAIRICGDTDMWRKADSKSRLISILFLPNR